jgi:hypothetical protein
LYTFFFEPQPGTWSGLFVLAFHFDCLPYGRTDGAFRLVLIFTSRLMDPLSGRFHISVSPGVCESLSPAVFFLDFSTPTKEKRGKEKKIPICVTTIVIHNELL